MTVEIAPVTVRCDECGEPHVLEASFDKDLLLFRSSNCIVTKLFIYIPTSWSSDKAGDYCPRCTEENNVQR